MLFSSLYFLIAFLPLTLIAVFTANKLYGRRPAMVLLLVASFIFYSWNTPVYLFLILGSIIINYTLGLHILKTRSRNTVAFGIVFNLALLAWFKYIGLFSQTLNDIANADISIEGVVLPLAISFFTFQQIAYLVDCLKGATKRYGFLEYALFVAFFPQLIAGPIVHHQNVVPQFYSTRFLKFRHEDIVAGLLLLSIGLAKKTLIADGLAPLSDGAFDAAHAGHTISFAAAWLGVFAYSFQIYFDFSGYTDMALGLAYLFGIKLPKNFNSPYKATNIVEFWRRWHITLSTFLRDYLYIPLGGNRLGNFNRYRNLFVVMLLGGFWHGAAWTFLVWGGLHGGYLCINHIWRRTFDDQKIFGGLMSTVLTFSAISIAWVFFRAENFTAAAQMFSAMSNFTDPFSLTHLEDSKASILIMLTAGVITWAMPNALEILELFQNHRLSRNSAFKKFDTGLTKISEAVSLRFDPAVVIMATLGCLTAFSLFALTISGSYEFIYFQF
ncbi:MAG: MBOAT family protein [Marinicaulis sp.]|nr:MBOAT family protein [Marinicaulis sp.]